MTGIRLLTVPTSGPDDLTALEIIESTTDVLAVIGKTEGNGCVNDFSRTLAAACWEPRLRSNAVTVFSGGTEGVLSPHVNLFVADTDPDPRFDRGLVAAVGETPPVPTEELGRAGQIDLVADTVTEIMKESGIDADEVHLVLVKCPLLTTSDIAVLHDRGLTPVCDDTYESMARSRASSSLGIARALNEVDETTALQGLAGTAFAWSNRASASAGAELDTCHILVLAENTTAFNPLRAVHTEMKDAYDLEALLSATSNIVEHGGRIRQLFIKAEADPSGAIRGLRHTMLTDSDVNATRHARAAVGALAAAVKGDGAVYVSGGAEHQGRPGGGSVTIVYEVDPPEASPSKGKEEAPC